MAGGRRSTWTQFTVWALCGASVGLILVAAFAIGPFAIVPAGLFAGLAVSIGGGNLSAVGSAAGLGVWGIVLAWLNRSGPGDVCTHSAGATSCVQEWSPWPFAIVALVLIISAVGVFATLRGPRVRLSAA